MNDCIATSVAAQTKPLWNEIELLKNELGKLTPSINMKGKQSNVFYGLFKNEKVGRELMKKLVEKNILQDISGNNTNIRFKITIESSERVSPVVCLYHTLHNKGYLKEGISITQAAASFCETFSLEQKSVECFYKRPAKNAIKKYGEDIKPFIPEYIDILKQLKCL